MIRPKGTAELEERTGKNAEDFLDDPFDFIEDFEEDEDPEDDSEEFE
jgi:hypothetical protein